MKTTLGLSLFLVALPVAAQTCTRLEFAELDSLPKEELLQMRCRYDARMIDPKLLGAGQYGAAEAQKCAEEAVRMDRIIARKYQLKNKGADPAIPYYLEINAMCRK